MQSDISMCLEDGFHVFMVKYKFFGFAEISC